MSYLNINERETRPRIRDLNRLFEAFSSSLRSLLRFLSSLDQNRGCITAVPRTWSDSEPSWPRRKAAASGLGDVI